MKYSSTVSITVPGIVLGIFRPDVIPPTEDLFERGEAYLKNFYPSYNCLYNTGTYWESPDKYRIVYTPHEQGPMQ